MPSFTGYIQQVRIQVIVLQINKQNQNYLLFLIPIQNVVFWGGTINLVSLSISKSVTCNCDLRECGLLKKPLFTPVPNPIIGWLHEHTNSVLLSTKRQMPFCAKKFQFIKCTDLGGRLITSAKDMDLKEILNLMYWCDHFIRLVPQPFIKYFRDIRNRKWGRA